MASLAQYRHRKHKVLNQRSREVRRTLHSQPSFSHRVGADFPSALPAHPCELHQRWPPKADERVDECGDGSSAQRVDSLHHVHYVGFLADPAAWRRPRLHGIAAKRSDFRVNATQNDYLRGFQATFELQQVCMCSALLRQQETHRTGQLHRVGQHELHSIRRESAQRRR